MSIPLLDTHQHLLMIDRLPYGWASDIPALAGKPFGYAEYLEAAAGTGIEGTLFMESAPDDPHWREETQIVLDMAADPDTLIRGVIANALPEDADGFAGWVDSIRGPHLRGIRRILHVVPDEVSQVPVFAENVRRLGAWGLTFDMCFLARQLPLAIDLAKKCPDTQLILDHCGVPDIASGEMDPWREHIRELAAIPNVACKISGVLAYCDPGRANLEAVRPYVEHCIECFGWDRVVWGGDWPVCCMTSDLKTWAQITRELVAGEDEDHQRKLFHANAERVYGVTLS